MASPTPDASGAFTSTLTVHTVTSSTVTVTTTSTNDVLIIDVYIEGTTNPAPHVTSVTATGLTFAKRFASGSFAGKLGFTAFERWWAPAAATLAALVVTVNYSGTVDCPMVIGYGINGCNNINSPWDTNAALPASNTSVTGVATTPTTLANVSTSQADDLLLWAFCTSDTNSTFATIPASYTVIKSGHNTSGTNDVAGNVASRAVAATQTNITIASATNNTINWIVCADALTADATTAAPKFGWSSVGDRERPPPVRLNPDESRQFFRTPSSFLPILLPTTGQEDRPLPAISRIDQPAPWFVRSPNPVPVTWLPTTGGEDRPPAQKRPPDEPGVYFRSPKSFSITWLPTTGEEDRPPPIKRPPDEPGAFFFQTQGTSRTTPTAWWVVGQDGYIKPIQRPPDEPYPWFVRSPSPVPTTWLPVSFADGVYRPFVADPYDVQSIPPFVAPPLQQFMAQTNADDFNPLPAFKYEDQVRFAFKPPVATVTPPSIVWLRADVPVTQFFFILT